MKVLIAVPTFETIYPDVFKSIYDLALPEGVKAYFEYVRGYDCATARNLIVDYAKRYDVDYVLMVDNDVIIPKDTLYYFLEDPVDVCLGYYAHRDPDNIFRGKTCICRLLDENGEPYFNYPLESEYSAKEMQAFRYEKVYKLRIHGGGMGCAFINTSVFNKLEYPWYVWVHYQNDEREMLSEDLYFCEQCRMNEIPIFTDTRIGCKHIFRRAQEVM